MDLEDINALVDATGTLEIHYSVKRHDEICASQAKNAEFYFCVEGTRIIIPLNDAFDPDMVDARLQTWLAEPLLTTRGVTATARDVIAKLKRLDFRPLPQKGTSHLHFSRPDGTGKVTVPVHRGEIPKGTFKSILNQAGIDLRTFQMA